MKTWYIVGALAIVAGVIVAGWWLVNKVNQELATATATGEAPSNISYTFGVS